MAHPTADNVEEELQAQVLVWNHIFQFISSMSLKSVVELGIPDVLHRNEGRPICLSGLASLISMPPNRIDYLRRLMRMLVFTGCFANVSKEGEEEKYVLTPVSRLLVKDNDTGVSPFLFFQLDLVMQSPWQSLGKWFHSDQPTSFAKVHGVDIFGMAERSERFNRMINEAMACDSRLMVKALVEKHRDAFVGVKSLVDVGGGTGSLAATIGKAFQWIKCAVLDLPHVVADAPKDGVVDFIGGDMFEHVPPADAVLLKMVLHDWSDEDCVKILKQCKKAIPPKEKGGKVMILDMIVNSKTQDHKATETQLFLDMLMMVDVGGREREEHEWKKIFTEAGFTTYKATHGTGVHSLIELYP
ncbi:Trans-resveratrol di-O-methyltransferase [Acorus gramineus]|uniref:Trans-resveratrol di-O-methyltransferase n=1 Tax=Acorus gramineus TaxID=55184 RepID=A0AAV9AWR5_ACOGR|nr:Trans-resveratrol di-O-methyltransferase [Acorus gramineus]